jgi:LCP family protein required for cell wall assembly
MRGDHDPPTNEEVGFPAPRRAPDDWAFTPVRDRAPDAADLTAPIPRVDAASPVDWFDRLRPADPGPAPAAGPNGTGGRAGTAGSAEPFSPPRQPGEQGPGGPDEPGGPGDPDRPAAAPPRRKRMTRARKALLGVGALLLVLVIGGALGVQVITSRVLGDVGRIPDVFAPIDEASRPQKPAGTEKTVNFLLVGVDTRAEEQTTGSDGDGGAFVPGRQRSDVIMVVHVSADRKAASVVSLPRDSWVDIPGRGKNKINAAYSLGGGSLLVQTVEGLTGLRIDHFAVVDFAGFKDITDAVGGIDVRVAKATGDNRGSFPAGLNHLDGDQALVYVRQRYNLPGGDLDRVRRQQNVIKALMSKAASRGLLSSPTGTLKLADAVARAVSVDDSLDNGALRSLVLSLRGLRPAGVTFLTAPVSGLGREGKQSVVRLDDARSAALWKAVTADQVPGYVAAHPEDRLSSNPR